MHPHGAMIGARHTAKDGMIPGIDCSVDINVFLRGLTYHLYQFGRCLRDGGVIHRCAALGEERCGHGDAAHQYQAQRKACRMRGSPDSFAHYNFFLHCFAPIAIRRAAVS